ncbi:hypothetical protein MVEN_00861800 [Mycena venus]|uniref:Uncharacterized protein n=1 Tax=Mycena venus TaxID=2733690 RepID=A0A8H7D3K6_9AGAR|nr:hypothetical protein MVEN_00861800 [Mycena venus]
MRVPFLEHPCSSSTGSTWPPPFLDPAQVFGSKIPPRAIVHNRHSQGLCPAQVPCPADNSFQRRGSRAKNVFCTTVFFKLSSFSSSRLQALVFLKPVPSSSSSLASLKPVYPKSQSIGYTLLPGGDAGHIDLAFALANRAFGFEFQVLSSGHEQPVNDDDLDDIFDEAPSMESPLNSGPSNNEADVKPGSLPSHRSLRRTPSISATLNPGPELAGQSFGLAKPASGFGCRAAASRATAVAPISAPLTLLNPHSRELAGRSFRLAEPAPGFGCRAAASRAIAVHLQPASAPSAASCAPARAFCNDKLTCARQEQQSLSALNIS